MHHLTRYLGIATLLFSSSLIMAQTTTPERPHHKHMRAKGHHFGQALNLTDAQRDQAKQIRERHATATKDLRDQMRQLRTSLREAQQAGDTARVESLSAQAGAVAGKLRTARMEFMREFQAILTPEQRQQMEQMRDKRGGRDGKQFRKFRNKG